MRIYKENGTTVIELGSYIYQGATTAEINATDNSVIYIVNGVDLPSEKWSNVFPKVGATPVGTTSAEMIAYNDSNLVFKTASGGSGAMVSPFGVDRYTDEFGTQTYASGIIIDWNTRTVGDEVLMIKQQTLASANHDGARALADALTIGTYASGWRLPSVIEVSLIWKSDVNPMTNWSPLNYSTAGRLQWLYDELLPTPTSAYQISNSFGTTLNTTPKTNFKITDIVCRTGTWNGTAII
tara:strand:+ start:130 stop:846 length:717 start_codon:yes stop_codon:yes gene_type:complete